MKGHSLLIDLAEPMYTTRRLPPSTRWTNEIATWEVRKQNLVKCTNATLNGSYGVLQTGFDVTGNAIGGVGLITFDGKGTWSLTLTEARKDVPVQRTKTANGSYTVNADCRGLCIFGEDSAHDGELGIRHRRRWERGPTDRNNTTPRNGPVVLKKQFSR